MNFFKGLQLSGQIIGTVMFLVCAGPCCTPHPLDLTKQSIVTITPAVSSIKHDLVQVSAEVNFLSKIIKRYDSIRFNFYLSDPDTEAKLGHLVSTRTQYEEGNTYSKVISEISNKWVTQYDTSQILMEYEVFKNNKSLISEKFLVAIAIKD